MLFCGGSVAVVDDVEALLPVDKCVCVSESVFEKFCKAFWTLEVLQLHITVFLLS